MTTEELLLLNAKDRLLDRFGDLVAHWPKYFWEAKIRDILAQVPTPRQLALLEEKYNG